MLLLVVLITITSAKIVSIEDTQNATKLVICNGLIFNDTFYDKKIVYKGSGRSLFMHERTGNLFFSHTAWLGRDMETQLIACHVESRRCRIIKGINGGFTVGYDRRKDKIYFGGIDGIYIYNNITDAAELFAEEGNSVWSIFILNNFYYIEYPSQHLYIKKGDLFVQSNLNIEVLTFHANEDKIYFSNRSGVYSAPKTPDSEPTVLSSTAVVRQITEDIYGNVYFCAYDGIYAEDKVANSLKKLAFVNDAFGMAFMNLYESDNIIITLIYSDGTSVFRLLPSEHSDICYAAMKKTAAGTDPLRENELKSVSLNVNLDFL